MYRTPSFANGNPSIDSLTLSLLNAPDGSFSPFLACVAFNRCPIYRQGFMPIHCRLIEGIMIVGGWGMLTGGFGSLMVIVAVHLLCIACRRHCHGGCRRTRRHHAHAAIQPELRSPSAVRHIAMPVVACSRRKLATVGTLVLRSTHLDVASLLMPILSLPRHLLHGSPLASAPSTLPIRCHRRSLPRPDLEGTLAVVILVGVDRPSDASLKNPSPAAMDADLGNKVEHYNGCSGGGCPYLVSPVVTPAQLRVDSSEGAEGDASGQASGPLSREYRALIISGYLRNDAH
ncbi:hypothetical protein ACLOJK_028841 [Asimina triloba]